MKGALHTAGGGAGDARGGQGASWTPTAPRARAAYSTSPPPPARTAMPARPTTARCAARAWGRSGFCIYCTFIAKPELAAACIRLGVLRADLTQVRFSWDPRRNNVCREVAVHVVFWSRATYGWCSDYKQEIMYCRAPGQGGRDRADEDGGARVGRLQHPLAMRSRTAILPRGSPPTRTAAPASPWAARRRAPTGAALGVQDLGFELPSSPRLVRAARTPAPSTGTDLGTRD